MSTSWASWVRGIEGLSPIEKLIAYELAFLADTRGVSVTPIDHLERVTCRSRRSVLTALQRLGDLGLLRVPEAMPRPFRGIRFQLTQEPPLGGTESQEHSRVTESPHDTPEPTVGDNESIDNQSLRRQLIAASVADWNGSPCWELAATLEKEGQQRFASVIGQRRSAGIRDPWDTLTLAWEVVRNHCAALSTAREPWALWVHLVRVEAYRNDLQGAPGELVEFRGPSGNSRTDLGIDDFGEDISGAVEALISLGVEEALAWAGTARVLELIGMGESRRHWMAGRDAKLQSLGIGEKAGRAWMTLLVGSRRGRTGVLTGATVDGIREQAEEVALAMRPNTDRG